MIKFISPFVTFIVIFSSCTTKNVEEKKVSQNSTTEAETFAPLELISWHQMEAIDSMVFDCSGIVIKNDSIFVIADKPWNSFIYQIEFEGNKWRVVNQFSFDYSERLDLEAIDISDGAFYLSNESSGEIYKVDKNNFEVQDIDFNSINQNPEGWGNAGWEGLAIDDLNKLMYLVKERDPRVVFVYDIKSEKIIDQFDIPQTESNDFSDAKFLDGYLYLLERNGNYVTKVNPKTHVVVSKYHYRDVASHPEGKIYGPTKYGMAESLVLTDNEIWIGLDNNGKSVTDYAIKKYQLTGIMPLFLKFKRPKDF